MEMRDWKLSVKSPAWRVGTRGWDITEQRFNFVMKNLIIVSLANSWVGGDLDQHMLEVIREEFSLDIQFILASDNLDILFISSVI